MGISKRGFLQGVAAGAGVLAAAGKASAAAAATTGTVGGRRSYQRIACEEACTTPDVVKELSRLANGVPSMKSGPIAGPFMPDLLDIGAGRVRGMDRAGIDVQILSLVSPGVQLFAPDTASALARDVNDRMADTIRQYPTRFGALAVVAPQAPAETARELQRCIQTLKFNGALINSHTNGEYLDQQKYWPVLEAIEALGVPLYLHPRDPAPGMEVPLAIPGFAVGWGYAVETGTHLLHLMAGGVFDRFPKLQVVLGHLGETLPFLLDRLDNRYAWQMDVFRLKALPRKPSEYLREQVVVTTSGMNYAAPVRAAIEAMGIDRVLFSADHPMEVQADAVTEMEGIRLTPTERRKTFEDNARRVFRLTAGAKA
jgi:2,3-dihydroxybenzoate decarboxylase